MHEGGVDAARDEASARATDRLTAAGAHSCEPASGRCSSSRHASLTQAVTPARRLGRAPSPFTRPAMPRPIALCALVLAAALVPASARDVDAQDRFAAAIAGAPESTVRNGYVVNHRRAAVQRELTARPPTEAELGVRLPPGARLLHEVTARQIAQYHPGWRIFQYRVAMSRDELGGFFAAQGLRYEPSEGRAYFPGASNQRGDFIDGLAIASSTGIRIWRMPPDAAPARP